MIIMNVKMYIRLIYDSIINILLSNILETPEETINAFGWDHDLIARFQNVQFSSIDCNLCNIFTMR